MREIPLPCLVSLLALTVACQGELPMAPLETDSPSAVSMSELTRSPALDVTAANSWATKSLIPKPSWFIHAATVNGVIYVLSSTVSEGSRPLQAYNVANNTWSARRPMPNTRTGGNGFSLLNGRLYVTGGYNDATETPTRTVYAYNPAANTWTKKADLPANGYAGAQAVIGGQLYVYAVSRSGGHFMWRYNATLDSWNSRRTPPTVHGEAASGVIGGKFYLAGGRHGTGTEQNPTLDVYDPVTNTWVTKAPMPAPVIRAASGVLDKKLHIAGGTSNGFTIATLHVYNPATNSWTTRAPIPTPRWGAAGAVADLRFFVISGYAAGATKIVEAYTP